jgi:anti-sigma B factor antagonist
MSAPLRIEGELTVFTAHALKERVMTLLDGTCDTPCIDLCQVSEVDGAGLQLLMAARREATRRGRTLRLIALSPQVLEALDLVNQTPDDEPDAPSPTSTSSIAIAMREARA